MSEPPEHLFTFLSRFAAVKYISEITNLWCNQLEQQQWAAIYIHTEVMRKILMNIFETNYCG
jgi:hypothetical protein